MKRLLCFLLIISVFASCTRQTPEEKRQEELRESADQLSESLEDFSKNLGNSVEGSVNDAMSEVNDAIDKLKAEKDFKDPVNFRELRKFLPEKLNGMERTDQEGQTSGAMGFKVSTTKSMYEAGDQRITVNLVDVGGLGMAMMGAAAWSKLDIDEENSKGFKRTLTIDGRKAYQECDNAKKRCELAIILADRFVLTMGGRNVTMADLMDMMEAMDLKGVERLE